MKRLIWGIFFLCVVFACSDDGGTIEDQSNEDRNFTVFTDIFQQFLESEASNTFTDGNSGLTFVGEQPCGVVQPAIFFNDQYISFSTTECFHYVVIEPYPYESFSIVNSKLLADGTGVYAVAAFLNMGIPETGTYQTDNFCDVFCYSTVSMRVYYVDKQGGLLSYYVSYPTSVEVVNINGKVSASFDAEFYSALYPFIDNAHGSGTVICCN